jgi:hypothetical protein
MVGTIEGLGVGFALTLLHNANNGSTQGVIEQVAIASS